VPSPLRPALCKLLRDFHAKGVVAAENIADPCHQNPDHYRSSKAFRTGSISSGRKKKRFPKTVRSPSRDLDHRRP
jgi:hypothetical protein